MDIMPSASVCPCLGFRRRSAKGVEKKQHGELTGPVASSALSASPSTGVAKNPSAIQPVSTVQPMTSPSAAVVVKGLDVKAMA